MTSQFLSWVAYFPRCPAARHVLRRDDAGTHLTFDAHLAAPEREADAIGFLDEAQRSLPPGERACILVDATRVGGGDGWPDVLVRVLANARVPVRLALLDPTGRALGLSDLHLPKDAQVAAFRARDDAVRWLRLRTKA